MKLGGQSICLRSKNTGESFVSECQVCAKVWDLLTPVHLQHRKLLKYVKHLKRRRLLQAPPSRHWLLQVPQELGAGIFKLNRFATTS